MISIIIPVYNSEKYLRECCDSILKQDYENYEVLLVNDGSTDNSANICDYYTTIDNRFKVFHKSNSGVSSARNFGINESKGDFITFVDSDDYLDDNYLTHLISNKTYDLVVGGAKYINQDGVQYYTSDNKKIEINNNYDFYESFFNIDISTILDAPWNKLYRRDYIIKNNIRFDETLFYGEDKLFTLRYLAVCNCLIQLESKSYNYRVYGNKKYIINYKYRLDWINKIEKAYKQVYKNFNFTADITNSLNTFLIHNYYLTLESLFDSKEKLRKKILCNYISLIFNKLSNYNITFNGIVSKKDKLLLFLFKIRNIQLTYYTFKIIHLL